jgi:hypothetical protein
MNDDTIYDYVGREAQWVALCGFYRVETDRSEDFTEADAPAVIDSVWDVCQQMCKEANVAVPPKHEAIAHLARMITAWNAQSRLKDGDE